MFIHASLSEAEVAALLDQMLPTEISFGKGQSRKGSLVLARPAQVRFLPGVGVRLSCRGQFTWRFGLGLGPLTIGMKRLQLLLSPVVERTRAGWSLAFRMRIEDAEFDMVPAFIERSAVDILNQALIDNKIALRWDYQEALTRSFDLSEWLQPIETMTITTTEASVRVLDRELQFDLPLHFAVQRKVSTPVPPVLPNPR